MNEANGTMTNEELNTALYQKMFAEQETYRKWLLTQPAEEILKYTYEYTVREDILMTLESNDLKDAQAVVLLKSPSPLIWIWFWILLPSGQTQYYKEKQKKNSSFPNFVSSRTEVMKPEKNH